MSMCQKFFLHDLRVKEDRERARICDIALVTGGGAPSRVRVLVSDFRNQTVKLFDAHARDWVCVDRLKLAECPTQLCVSVHDDRAWVMVMLCTSSACLLA
jgi:hypothetical protein